MFERYSDGTIGTDWSQVAAMTIVIALLVAGGLGGYFGLYRPFVSDPPIERLEAREQKSQAEVDAIGGTLRRAESLQKGPVLFSWERDARGASEIENRISTSQGEVELKMEIERLQAELEEAKKVHEAAKYRLKRAEDRAKIEAALARP